jgi:septum formation inhibitor-activating ATPase MinD
MKMHWYALTADCPKCNKEMTILDVAFAADGDIGLNCVCVLCGTEARPVSSMVALIQRACHQDIMKSMYEKGKPC